jgi:hypothetical protein
MRYLSIATEFREKLSALEGRRISVPITCDEVQHLIQGSDVRVEQLFHLWNLIKVMDVQQLSNLGCRDVQDKLPDEGYRSGKARN